MAGDAREVPPINITNHVCQTRKQRFSGYGDLHHVNDDQHHIHLLPSNAETSHLKGAPLPATWRMNLVALSQKYNMYFAAYKDTIHVTRPRTLKQILPGVPDLILRLPVSKYAVPRTLQDRPHCVNNMIIGNLGSKEILLFCSDDGDVTAYYTDLIAEELQKQTAENKESSIPIGSTQPFFLENVGRSAWGLAIHQKSRLIAVSSNEKEVTVFVHGTYSKDSCHCAVIGTNSNPDFDPGSDPLVQHGNSHRDVPTRKRSFTACVYESDGPFANSSFPCRVLSRDMRIHPFCSRNSRIILRPIFQANIPSITFADDDDGFAESIIATDIEGDLWLLSIWQHHPRNIGAPLHRSSVGQPQMGWGVMNIPLRYFKNCPNFQDALGVDDLDLVLDDSTMRTSCMNITSGMRRVELFPLILQDADDESANPPMPDNLRVEGLNLSAYIDLFMDDLSSAFDNTIPHSELSVEVLGPGGHPAFSRKVNVEPIRHTDGTTIINSDHHAWVQDGEDIQSNSPPSRLRGLEYFKEDGLLPDYQRVKQPALQVSDFVERLEALVADPDFNSLCIRSPPLRNGAVILRTWQDSIELVPSSTRTPSVVCSKRLFRKGRPRAFGQIYNEISRINMMALIPELSLVVVASQNGQAALLTLTRVSIQSTKVPITAFRVEALLPPRKYGENYLIGYDGPRSPLLGMAVSPIQKGDGIELNAGEDPKKWRLIMQSYEHTIWTYELSRDENNNLRVF